MSKREDIAGNIVTAISTGTTPITLKKVTREPFNVDELSEQQYPACFVQSGEVSTDEGVLFPVGGIRMVVRVMYQYTSGTP
jgi:hypothetical protein